MSHPTVQTLDFALPVKTSSYKPASFSPLSGKINILHPFSLLTLDLSLTLECVF